MANPKIKLELRGVTPDTEIDYIILRQPNFKGYEIMLVEKDDGKGTTPTDWQKKPIIGAKEFEFEVWIIYNDEGDAILAKYFDWREFLAEIKTVEFIVNDLNKTALRELAQHELTLPVLSAKIEVPAECTGTSNTKTTIYLTSKSVLTENCK